MDDLPQEIVDHIANHVVFDESLDPGPYTRLSPLATLSRAWQDAIESITFQKLEIKSDELYTFQQLMTGRRRHYLADLEFEVVLPTYTSTQAEMLETPIDRQANNACFTRAVRELFITLKDWENEEIQRPMRLGFGKVFSAVDTRKGIPLSGNSRHREVSYISLIAPDSLPTLSRVRELDFYHPYMFPETTMVSPQEAPLLLKLLPNINKTFWHFNDLDDESEKIAYAEAIKATKLQLRSELIMEFCTTCIDGHVLVDPILLPYGLLSAAIRTVSQNLTVMTLEFNFDATLFWPSTSESSGTPYWPHLKELRIESKLFKLFANPDFYRMEYEDSNEDDYNDNEIIRVTEHPMAPILAAFAKAVQNMPSLEYFYFLGGSEELLGGTPIPLPGLGTFVIVYHCPGPWRDRDRMAETKEEKTFRRIYYACENGNIWRPEDEVVVALRNAGEEKFGGKLIEGSRMISMM
ncbi:hypothetical protein P3342_000340 [Pyrenophora teres f. teres]|uniref:Uncharacterized protein n=1 Tax=Pyrenophora teres f. teres TaxID=97479 RepID=A0A6S6VBJ3_9PLEO|nr:hypothetical protein HRS9139_04562 [Pyrenophora teres f. teres]KAE8837564.1 hypothetical protein PTNB85_04899 [Pyrenophora teres f. teres]KAE8862390.1 hypothetical protein PTNB29_04952 [Pyrenophora teres f. teres]KAE8869370.1 hypothetical protein PTNB73_04423 [Pyrenophora teres f. teres]KAK1917627.1 hypothetical protein P3342_000340 [Pyrenophora teres f. teres]